MNLRNRYFSIIFFLAPFGPGSIVSGQNLVYNPSFETLSSCPLISNDVATTPYAEGWLNPNTATPDLFTNCNSGVFPFTVPNNVYGTQNARSGNQYAGIYAIQSPYNGREYLQTKLTHPMVNGRKYCFSAYYSLAEIYSTVTIKKLGCYFSKDRLKADEITPNFNFISPQILYTGDTSNQLTDWLLFESEYFSEGGEQYLTIGNFFPDSLSDTMAVDHNTWVTARICYFYIDDVSLECCDPRGCGYGIPNSFTPNGDGYNDIWEIDGLLSGSTVEIFNRWGNIVFRTDNYDGSWKADKLPDGTYYYVVNGADGQLYTGFLEIMR